MATITPTQTVNPATMAANWKTYTSQAGNKWLAKYLAPKVVFNHDPATWQTNWYNGVTAAHQAGTPAKMFGAADVATKAANAASTYGHTNYVAAATNKAGNYTAVTPALAGAITSSRAAIASMPRSTFQDRIARMTAFSTAMHSHKGNIKTP